jgi:hypothetical protein
MSMITSINSLKNIELLQSLQPSKLNTKEAIFRIDQFLQWFMNTKPTFSQEDAQCLLYGDAKNIGVMQACGPLKLSSRHKEKSRRKRRDKHIKFLATLIGLVDTSPTHPAYNSSYNSGSSLTKACVNAPLKILTKMCLQDFLCQQLHYDDPDVHFCTCQLVHTIINLRNQIKQVSLSVLLNGDRAAIDFYMSWLNTVVIKPGHLIDTTSNPVQNETKIHEEKLKSWSELSITNGFDPITGEGDGGVGVVIDRLLQPFMKSGTTNNNGLKNSAVEAAINAVFSRTDELGRSQGKRLGYHRDHMGTSNLGKRDGREKVYKTKTTKLDDGDLLELVRNHFTSFVKAQRMCGSILTFLTARPDSSISPSSLNEEEEEENKNDAFPPFLNSTRETLNELEKCIETNFIPVIKKQELAANLSHSVDLLKFLDPVTFFSSNLRELLMEEDYDSCVIEFENVVEFVRGIPPEYVSTVDETSSSVSLHLHRVLDASFQTLRQSMSEHAGRTDVSLGIREHLVELYRILYYAFESLHSSSGLRQLSSDYNVQSFVRNMFKQFENNSIERFASCFQTASSSYNSKSRAWDGLNALQICRRIVDEIYEDFKVLITSDILMNAFDRREDRAATKTNIYSSLVKEMVLHMKTLIQNWRQIGENKVQWFDLLCDFFSTFHGVENHLENYSYGSLHNIVQSWMKSISQEIIERCSQRIEIKIKHLDLEKILRDITRIKKSKITYDVASLKVLKECLNRCIQKKITGIFQSFQSFKVSSSVNVHQQDYYHIDPLCAAVNQLGVWHSFERAILDILGAIYHDVDGGSRFSTSTQVKVALSEGSATLMEGVVELYETMLKQKLKLSDEQHIMSLSSSLSLPTTKTQPLSSSSSSSLLSFDEISMYSEILMDIVCLKNDLIQHEWSDIDTLVGRLLATVGLVPKSSLRKALQKDPSCKMLIEAL